MSQVRIPAWISVGVLPAVNILLAFLVSAILFYYLDINPVDAAEIMWYGAFGTGEGIGFTLYYATGFIFTGLAVAVAFHAGLFNIGGEGQAYIGGLGVGLVCLLLGDVLPFALLLPLAIIAGGLFGAAWAFIPAWLQAKRGSHIVITTIMFNFIAASLMAYLLVDVFKPPGSMATESKVFAVASWLPKMSELAAGFGEAHVGVVGAQRQPVLRPASEHPVWLVGAFCDQIVNQYAYVSLRAVQYDSLKLVDLLMCVDAGHQSLTCRLFIACCAIDLACEIQILDQLCLQRLLQLDRWKIVVFNGITWTEHFCLLKTSNGLQCTKLNILW